MVKFAIDGKFEQYEIACLALNLQMDTVGLNFISLQRRILAGNLPLVQKGVGLRLE